MAGLTSALNTGKTSLEANQLAIEVIGNNISNANTDGYSRQTVNYSNVPTYSQKGFFIGQGVKISSIEREHDQFLENQLLEKTSTYGYENSKTNTLAELERIFPVTDDNIATDIGNFFDAFEQLSTDPSDQVLRYTAIQKGQDLSTSFQNTANELSELQNNISDTISSKADTINSYLTEIADLNNRIQIVETAGQPANGQRDQQEALIRKVAEAIGAETVSSSASGMVSLSLPNGLPLVQGTTAAQLSFETTSGNDQLILNVAGEKKYLNSDTVGGDMKGTLELRDKTIPDMLDKLDSLAYNIINAVNGVHSSGTNLNGDTGINFFETPPNEGGALNPADPDYASSSRFMTVAISDANEVAAGTTAKTGDNENALAIASLNDEKINNDTFATQYAKIASDVGTIKSRNETAISLAETAMEQVGNLKESATGISLDEEMINLLSYQRSYQSSAKFLSTVDEMMDTLINIR